MELTSWQKLDKYFSKKSMMEILGVDRDENAHSKFLGWLFENEDTREVAIKSLLVLLKDKREQEQKNTHFPRSLYEINWDTFSIKDTKVTLEDFVEVCGRNESGNKVTDKNGNEIKYYGRADIVIDVSSEINSEEKSFHIIIENKINSFEHIMGRGQKYEDAQGALWQTVGYYYYYKEKYGEENCVFVFLTRHKSQIEIPKKIKDLYKPDHKDGRAQSDSFIWIDYQNVLDSILVKVLDSIKESLKGTKQTKDSCTSLSEITIRINDYIRCLCINKTQENLMAICSDSEIAKLSCEVWKDNKELFNDLVGNRSDQNFFWRENKVFIQPLFEILAYLCDIDDEKGKNEIKEKDQIRKIKNIVNGKDFTTYEIKKDGTPISVEYTIRKKSIYTQKLGKNALVRTVVWLYMHENEKMRSLESLQSAFPMSLRIKGKRFDSDAITNKVIDGEKRDRWKPIKDIKVFCDNNELKSIELEKDLYVIQTGWDGTDMMNRFIEHAHKLLGDMYHIEEVVPEEQTKGNDE
jgi:hypothetical protein